MYVFAHTICNLINKLNKTNSDYDKYTPGFLVQYRKRKIKNKINGKLVKLETQNGRYMIVSNLKLVNLYHQKWHKYSEMIRKSRCANNKMLLRYLCYYYYIIGSKNSCSSNDEERLN